MPACDAHLCTLHIRVSHTPVYPAHPHVTHTCVPGTPTGHAHLCTRHTRVSRTPVYRAPLCAQWQPAGRGPAFRGLRGTRPHSSGCLPVPRSRPQPHPTCRGQEVSLRALKGSSTDRSKARPPVSAGPGKTPLRDWSTLDRRREDMEGLGPSCRGPLHC